MNIVTDACTGSHILVSRVSFPCNDHLRKTVLWAHFLLYSLQYCGSVRVRLCGVLMILEGWGNFLRGGFCYRCCCKAGFYSELRCDLASPGRSSLEGSRRGVVCVYQDNSKRRWAPFHQEGSRSSRATGARKQTPARDVGYLHVLSF